MVGETPGLPRDLPRGPRLAGAHIEASLRDRLDEHAGRDIEGTRIAITESQVPDLVASGLEPVEKFDRRFRPARQYSAWETEALGQAPHRQPGS